MATLNFQMRGAMKHLAQKSRLTVLTTLILHSNVRLRCFPSVDFIALENDLSIQTVINAKKWLDEHGAFVLVPYDKRMDEECNIPPSQHVYQLTGVLNIDGEQIPYLYLSPESLEEISKIVREISPNVLKSRVLDSRTSKIQNLSSSISLSSSSSKDNPISKNGKSAERGTPPSNPPSTKQTKRQENLSLGQDSVEETEKQKRELSPLAKLISQQIPDRRNFSEANKKRLREGVIVADPSGDKLYPSPDELYRDDPDFPAWCSKQIAYVNTTSDKTRSHAVNSVRMYADPKNGWLVFKAAAAEIEKQTESRGQTASSIFENA